MSVDPIQEYPLSRQQSAHFPRDYQPKLYRMGNCSIFVGREPVNGDTRDLRWHLSIAHPWRLPTWDELKEARARLLPDDVHFCIPMPPEKYWLSVHEFCLHLFEVADFSLTAQWEFEGMGGAA